MRFLSDTLYHTFFKYYSLPILLGLNTKNTSHYRHYFWALISSHWICDWFYDPWYYPFVYKNRRCHNYSREHHNTPALPFYRGEEKRWFENTDCVKWYYKYFVLCIYPSSFLKYSTKFSIATTSCSIVSLWRIVTAFFSRVLSKSIVTHQGVPISSNLA